MCCLPDEQLTCKCKEGLKVKGQKKIYQENTNQKKSNVAILDKKMLKQKTFLKAKTATS